MTDYTTIENFSRVSAKLLIKSNCFLLLCYCLVNKLSRFRELVSESNWNFEIIGKGIKNGCPCIVEIRGTQGCALVGDPARAVGECRDVAKAQP